MSLLEVKDKTGNRAWRTQLRSSVSCLAFVTSNSELLIYGNASQKEEKSAEIAAAPANEDIRHAEKKNDTGHP